MTTDARLAFADRLAEVCDDLGMPKHGRKTQLGALCSVSYQAAKRWLDGEGWPDMDNVLLICKRAAVNVNWLLQGVGPKRGQQIDANQLGALEAIDSLPVDDRQQTFDFIRYKVEKADGWFAAEKLARYMTMLDRISETQKPEAPPREP